VVTEINPDHGDQAGVAVGRLADGIAQALAG
jgi:hypothetical protein